MKKLYEKGWVRIVIEHGDDLLYFNTFNIHWKHLTRSQKSWLYSAAMYGVKINGDKIEVKDNMEIRIPPYKLQFGASPKNIMIDPDNLRERNQ